MPPRCVAPWLALCLGCLAADSSDIRVVRFSEGKPFHMGKVTSMRVVSPDNGAKALTLNLSVSQAGSEFSQHVHDYSDDTILVLEGSADLRQGDSRTPMKAGTCAFVPQGQIHGTITTTDETVMISTQTPPDLVLYTGARDSSKPGAAPPKGVITPGAVKYVNFNDRTGFFVDTALGAKRVAVARRVLKKGETYKAEGLPDGQQMVFVWKGAVSAASGKEHWAAGEKDTVLWQGSASVQVTGDSAQPTIVFHIQAPPNK